MFNLKTTRLGQATIDVKPTNVNDFTQSPRNNNPWSNGNANFLNVKNFEKGIHKKSNSQISTNNDTFDAPIDFSSARRQKYLRNNHFDEPPEQVSYARKQKAGKVSLAPLKHRPSAL